jgi:hypothetical protein
MEANGREGRQGIVPTSCRSRDRHLAALSALCKTIALPQPTLQAGCIKVPLPILRPGKGSLLWSNTLCKSLPENVRIWVEVSKKVTFSE